MTEDRPTLGERARALRSKAPSEPPRWTPPEPAPGSSTTRALGAAFGLLGAFLAAMAFAFVLSRLVGGIYITFALPIFVGVLIASLASYGPKRFGFGDKRPLVWIMVLATLTCWLGQHLLAYLRVIDIVAAESGLSGPLAAESALGIIEDATSEQGFWAYLSYVSAEPTSLLSPVGYLGRLGLGAVGTILVGVGELALMTTAGALSILYRTRALRRPPDGPVAWFDADTSAPAVAALESRRFRELPELAARSRRRPVHTLVLEEGAVTAEIALFTVDPMGRPADRMLTKTMPIEASRVLRAELAAVLHRDGGPGGV